MLFSFDSEFSDVSFGASIDPSSMLESSIDDVRSCSDDVRMDLFQRFTYRLRRSFPKERRRFFPKENKSRIDTTSDVGETPTNLFYFIPSFVHSATASIVGSLKAYGAEAVCS